MKFIVGDLPNILTYEIGHILSFYGSFGRCIWAIFKSIMLYDIWRDIEDLDFMKPVFLWQQEHDEHFPQYETTTPHMCHKLTYAKIYIDILNILIHHM